MVTCVGKERTGAARVGFDPRRFRSRRGRIDRIVYGWEGRGRYGGGKSKAGRLFALVGLGNTDCDTDNDSNDDD